MWLYIGKKDLTRYNLANFTDEELLDEVRRLTCFTKVDNIPLEALADPYDFEHLPGVMSLSIDHVVILPFSISFLIAILSFFVDRSLLPW